MTITSSGQLVLNSYTTSGDVVLGSYITDGAVLLDAEPPTPTIVYPLIEYNEDTEMFQAPGTTESHPVQMQNLSTGAIAGGTLTVSHVWYELNNGTETEWTPAPTISAFSDNMLTFKCAIPSTLGGHAFVDGDKIRVAIIGTIDAATVYGQFYVNFRTPEATLLSNIYTQVGAAITAFDTATPIAKTSELSGLEVDLSTITGGGTATLDSLEDDIAAISITGGSSAEKIIPTTYYSLDASEKTITLSGTFTGLTITQIKKIKNLTTNYIIYDSEDKNYKELPIYTVEGETDIFHFTAANPGATDDDYLQITVSP